MAYHPSGRSQLIQSVRRFEFERPAQVHDRHRPSDALPRCSEFIALAMGHLGQRHSWRDMEAALASESRQHYQLPQWNHL
jgi:putative transposase